MKKNLVILLLLTSSFMGYAVPYDENKNTLYIVTNQYNKSIIQLEAQAKNCRILTKKNILPIEKIKQLKLSASELSTALAYYSIKSGMDCEQEAINQYLLNASLLQLINKSMLEEIMASNELILHPYKQLIRVEAEFLALDLAVRNKLATIEELNQPFDFMTISVQLGLD